MLTAFNKHRRLMIFANKKRVIEVIQCSGDDMSFVLTNGMPQLTFPIPAGLPAPALSAPALPPPAQIALPGPVLSPGIPKIKNMCQK